MFVRVTLVSLVALMLAAGAPKPASFPTEPGPDGKPVTMPTFRRPVGKPAIVVRMAPSRPDLVEGADAVVHVPTGVRLPRVHRGCRLAVVMPLGGQGRLISYGRGAMAEYDCTPSSDLTNVEVSFETDVPKLRRGDHVRRLVQIANQLTQDIAKVDRSICLSPIPSPNPLHAGLTVTQCGIRWNDSSNPERHTYGVATMVLGRGTSFIRFTRRCVDAQCEASLIPFANSFDSFDVRSLADKPAR